MSTQDKVILVATGVVVGLALAWLDSGSDVSVRVGELPDADSVDPVVVPKRTYTLEATAEQLRAAHDAAPKAVSLRRVNTEVEANVQQIVKKAPKAILQRIRDVIEESAKAAGTPLPASIRDPGNPAHVMWGDEQVLATTDASEAADALDAVSRIISTMPAVKRLMNTALARMDQLDLLGHGPLSTALVLIAAAAAGTLVATQTAGGAPIVLAGRLKGGGTFKVSAAKTGEYAASITLRNPLWTKQAIDFAIKGDVTQDGRFRPTPTSATLRLPMTVLDKPKGSVTIAPYASISETERRAGIEGKVRF